MTNHMFQEVAKSGMPQATHNDDDSGGSIIAQSVGLASPLVTELVWLNHAHLPAGNTYRQHLHAYYQLDVILSGTVDFLIEDRSIRNRTRGDAIVIPPMIRHSTHSKKGYQHCSMKMFLAPHFAAGFGDREVVFEPSPETIALFDEAGRRLADHDGAFALEQVLCAGTLLLIDAVKHVQQDDAPPTQRSDFRRLVLPILQAVDESPRSVWTVARMAEQCYLSADHFTKCFKRSFGQSPQQYLIASRMRYAAAELLNAPTKSVKQVSDEIGYSSVQTFSRAFKHFIGVSPAEFRASPDSGAGASTGIILPFE